MSDQLDASPVTGVTHELAELRRRAYGPRADITTDPGAQARLEQLERLFRAVSRDEPGVEETVASADEPRPDVDEGAGVDARSGASAAELTPPARPRGRGRVDRFIGRHPLAVTIAASALLVLAGVSVGPSITTNPHPDAILHAAERDHTESLSVLPYAERLGVDPASLQQYEQFHSLVPWTGMRSDGARCIFAVGPRPSAPAVEYFQSDVSVVVATTCVHPDLDPTLDLISGFTVSDQFLEGPAGTVIRFVWRGDDVLGWWRSGPTTTPPSAVDQS